MGTPSVRQYTPSAQRGSGSPGYHLPWPTWSSAPDANRRINRCVSTPASSRLRGESAAMFHSGPSMSSIDTKVGSPPCVSRTSCASSSPSTRSPSASMACHSASSYGRVTRGILVHPGDRHREREASRHVAHDPARDRRRARRHGGARERDVSLAGEEAGRRIESDPAGARYVDLRPGMQVREVAFRAARAVEGLHVGDELDEIAGDEARRQPEVAERLHEQPARVPTRAAAPLERLLGRLHARLHADEIADVARRTAVQADEEIRRGDAPRPDLAPRGVEPGGESRAGRLGRQVGRQLVGQLLGVRERVVLGVLLDEEVERIDHGHAGDEVDRERQVARRLGKHEARDPVAVRILLPVDEVPLRRDAQRVGRDRGARVRRGPQPHLVGRQRHRHVERVDRLVVQCNADRHGRDPHSSQGNVPR